MEIRWRPEPSCPVCGSGATSEFLRRLSVPVHQNLLLDDWHAARDVTRGDLVMCLCQRCGFGFNAAFRPDLLDYGQGYDNTQNWSPAFDKYVDELVRELVEVQGVRGCRVVEVGCGKGTFLKKLVAYPGGANVGFGFDPSYVGPDTDLEGRVNFRRTFFTAAADADADIIVCRHVIEHVQAPGELLRAIRDGLAESRKTRVFIETPCLEWILRRQVAWDFFYEHCSLFTAQSLATAMTRAGFADVQVRHRFAGQYLWAEANVGDGAELTKTSDAELSGLARKFMVQEQEWTMAWQDLVRTLTASGPVAVWGAGAKGVTFCNLIDPQCEMLRLVIDVNPGKQGKYVAGTGHRIVGPDHLRHEDVAAVLVLNPMYAEEIVAQVRQLGSRAAVINAMEPQGRKACA